VGKGDESAQALADVTHAQVKTMLGRMAEEMQLHKRHDLKDFLATVLDRVELDPEEATLQVCYRIRCVVGIVWRPIVEMAPLNTH
jgi:hypothetical protein